MNATPLKLASQIWYLALADLQRRYVGTRLGFLWALVQPTVQFAVFWFVSVYGLKMGDAKDGTPFFAVLFCGLLPWTTLSGAIHGAAGALRKNRHLLFERATPTFALIMSSALAAAIMHIPLVAIVAFIFVLAGIKITWAWLAILYYMICLVGLCLAMGALVAPLAVYSTDIAQFINTALILWFWCSPIIWSPSLFPPAFLPYLQLNPVFYIVEGHRGALLHNDPFPASLSYDLLFWATTGAIFAVGLWLLRLSEPRLREWLQR